MRNSLKILGLAVTALCIVISAGCKKASPANAAFVGRYVGTISGDFDSSLSSMADTFKVTETSSPNQIALLDSSGQLSLIGNVSGDSIVSIQGGAPFSTGCSAAFFSGTGSLNGVVLTLNCAAPITCAGGSGSISLHFLGTRL